MNRDLELLIAFLAPIRDLLLDDSVTEIMGNPDASWWYGQAGRMHRAEGVTFEARSLHTSLEVIANQLGKKLDGSHPLLNAQLPDGSRLAAVLPPVVKPFPSVTIRKFGTVRYTVSDLVERGAMPVAIAEFLRDQIEAGRTMLISGGTDSGKTTVLNALTDFIPEDERIIVIEDTRELRIAKPNVLAAECQTDAHSGTVDFDDLLKASLRWRPDRIILGEIRREGARTLLDSFNTGHAGSMATIHASSARQALRRFSENWPCVPISKRPGTTSPKRLAIRSSWWCRPSGSERPAASARSFWCAATTEFSKRLRSIPFTTLRTNRSAHRSTIPTQPNLAIPN